MKIIDRISVLVYYDGPQVFDGRDQIGGYYIGTALPEVGDVERFLVVGVAPDKLRQFRNSKTDLLTLITERPEQDWYIAYSNDGLSSPIELELQGTRLQDADLLPEPGFFLRKRSKPVSTPIRTGIRRDQLHSDPVMAVTG